MTESFREGDRVEWIGARDGERLKFPQTGERGWIEQIDPMDDIVEWEEAGIAASDFTRGAPIRRVDDRNEPDPAKRLPGDPFDPHTTS
jgi:hypothetical protein